jgi:hypothetical protein
MKLPLNSENWQMFVMQNVFMLIVIMLSAIMLSVIMLSVIMLSVIMLCVIMLSVIMLIVIMLSVIMLIVIMLRFFMLSVIMLSCHYADSHGAGNICLNKSILLDRFKPKRVSGMGGGGALVSI